MLSRKRFLETDHVESKNGASAGGRKIVRASKNMPGGERRPTKKGPGNCWGVK